MVDQPYPKDENLRLILAEDQDQEQWISVRLNRARKLSQVWGALAMISAVVLALTFWEAPGPDCFRVFGDGPEKQKMITEFLAEGLKPCPPDWRPEEKGILESLPPWLGLVVLLMLMTSVLVAGRQVLMLLKYRRYLAGHRAFLDKYNRRTEG